MPAEPDEIYRRTQEEGRRRLSRSPLELAATSLVAGFDVIFGIVALGVTHALVAERFGDGLGELLGAIAFGTAFVFIVVGRSELFTENFLLPIAGLDQRSRRSWLSLAQLWSLSPVFNVLGGVLLALIVTTGGVLPEGTSDVLAAVAEEQDSKGVLAAFMSAVVAGALITLMTWLIEAYESIGVRIVCAWIVGALLALVALNHVVVVTLELFIGIRFDADVGWDDVFGNLGVAAVGNLVGGVVFVSLTRFGQARGARERR